MLETCIRKKCRNAYMSVQNVTVISMQCVHEVALRQNSFQAGLQKSISLEKNSCGKYRVSLSILRIDEKCKNMSRFQ